MWAQDGPSLAVAALRCGGSEAQALDLILDQYSEFSVEGPAPVHVTGALSRPKCHATCQYAPAIVWT